MGERSPRSQRGGSDAQVPNEAAGSDRRLQLAMQRRKVQRKASGAAAGRAPIPKGGGTPLGGDVKTRMEGELGADLSGVQLHNSGESADAAKSLGARAFTVGNDVHFNAGELRPGTKEGDRLLAHELTHVVQGGQWAGEPQGRVGARRSRAR